MKTSYDPENIDTFYYVDEWGMLRRKPLSPEENSIGRDSISRTTEGYFAWEDIELIYANRSCVLESYDERGYYLKVYRHPNNRDKDMSRDHIQGLLLGEKLAGNDDMLKHLAKNLRYRISEKHRFTPDLWAWMKILAGKWWWGPVFFIISYFLITCYLLWNKFWLWYGRFSPEVHPKNWYPQWPIKHATESHLRISKGLYPTYALNGFCWQLYVLKSNVFVRGLRWLTLQMVPRYNFLLKLLLGDKSVREIDVTSYKLMRGGRFSITLNESCDRYVDIITDPDLIAANRLEEDLLKKLWEQRTKN